MRNLVCFICFLLACWTCEVNASLCKEDNPNYPYCNVYSGGTLPKTVAKNFGSQSHYSTFNPALYGSGNNSAYVTGESVVVNSNSTKSDAGSKKQCLLYSIKLHNACLDRVADDTFIRELVVAGGAAFFTVTATPAAGGAFLAIASGANGLDSAKVINKCNAEKNSRDLDC